MVAVDLIGSWISVLAFAIAVFLGLVAAWLWWAYSIPRWRAWALGTGVDADKLQDLVARTWLGWPRGSIFEKTEFRMRSRR